MKTNLYSNCNTVGCRYNAVQYDLMLHYLHTALQWLKQNINQNLNWKETSHISPSLVIRYGVSILEKTDRVIMALDCISWHTFWDKIVTQDSGIFLIIFFHINDLLQDWYLDYQYTGESV